MEELQQHQGEWFFLHELNVDKVFSTIQRADYLILYYIKVEQEAHPGEKLYLADLAAAMGLRVTELSKGIEKLQDSGFVTWKTDREAGRTYVELSSKAVELMAEEQALLQRCYRRMRTELGDEELRRAAATMQRATAILKEERENLEAEFAALPCTVKMFPSHANFFLARVTDAVKIYNYLVGKGIIVRNRNSVSLCGNCLRVTVGTRGENEKLIEALKVFTI